MSLPETQQLFQDRLLGGGDAIRSHLTGDGPHLKVYEQAYGARLLEVLGEDFPALHTLLGDTAFAEAATAYIGAHPSQWRSIRWLGRELPGFLATTPPWNDVPVLADMARFEWGLGFAFDAPDADALSIEALGQVPPEAWPVLAFEFHPALNLFEVSHDVARFQAAVAAETDPDGAPEPLDGTQIWAAWREAETLMVHYRALAPDEAAGLAALMQGADFARFCEVLADHGAGDEAALRAAALLRHWIEAGWIVGLEAEGLSWA